MRKPLAIAAVLLPMAAPGHAKPTVIGVSMALFDDNFLTGVRQAMADTAKAIENAVKLARGEKVEQFDLVPYELVTPENYKTFFNR